MFSKLRTRLVTVTSFALSAILTVILSIVGISPASAFVGTLENGNLAYAAGSGFDKGEACNYLPGFEKGYDAWHFVLTSRGATFQQDPTNPAVSINLNLIFMRQDGSTFVIKTGAWVQTGKGAYTYTPVADRIRMVQTGSVAKINGLDSGMRLSHTCPGTGTPTNTTTTASPSPTPSPTASPTATATRTPTPTPTQSMAASPSASPSPSASVASTPTPTPTPTSTVLPTIRPAPSVTPSAIQIRPTRPAAPTPTGSPCPCKTPAATLRNPIPTPSPTQQGIGPSPTPTTTRSPSPSATPTSSAMPTPEPTNSNPPIELPVPPKVEDPKNVIYVDPITPVVIPPTELPSPPKGQIEIVVPPKYGEITITPEGEITYTTKLTDPKSTLVDVVELKYTNLSGQAVVIRKEFVLSQKGDVPRIIQTGSQGNSKGSTLWLTLIITLTTLVAVHRFRGERKYE